MPAQMLNIGRQVKGWFFESAAAVPKYWREYATEGSSQGPDETLWWMGALPKPYEYAGEYGFQGLLDFTYNIVNKELVMSVLIDLKSMEDNPEGAIMRRMSQAAAFWEGYKNEQLGALINVGGTGLAYDGVAFFIATRTRGLSGTIDNNLTDTAWNPATAPTTAQFMDSLGLMWANLLSFADDQGRKGYNDLAATQLRLLVRPAQGPVAMTVAGGELINNNSNPFWKGRIAVDVLSHLTVAQGIYLAAVGDPNSRPFIYQERTQPEITVFEGRNDQVENHGIKVIVRQRYAYVYGEPARIIKLVGS